jgi:hypothetical protein
MATSVKNDQSLTGWWRRCDRCGGVEPEVRHIARLFRSDLPVDLYPWRWVCGDCIDAVVDAPWALGIGTAMTHSQTLGKWAEPGPP